MKVAICCDNADKLGGSIKLAALLASGLKKKGLEIACVSLKKPKQGKSFSEFFDISNWYVPPISYPESLPGNTKTIFYQNYFLLANELKKCEKEFGPDIMVSALWDGANVFRLVSAQTKKLQYVHFPVDAYLATINWRIHAPSIKSHYNNLQYISRVICNSNFTKQAAYNVWKSYLPESKFDVIYPCIKWRSFQVSDTLKRKRQICYVGRIIPEKGVEIVVESFIKANIPNSNLVIAGSFSAYPKHNNRLKKKLLSLKSKGVQVIENPSDQEIAVIYNSSMAFANFSPLEHFGMCVVEAMASGTPPIIADGGGQRESVIDGETGFRVNLNARNITDEIAKYMRVLLLNDDIFASMSNKARYQAKQFDESNFINKWINILQSEVA
jgi:Glycosyltransferase